MSAAREPAIWTLLLEDEASTIRLAHQLAPELGANDLLTLSGELGTGKTCFARALIRAKLDAPDAEIASPSYTLVQSFDACGLNIVHADFYRISDPSELVEIGWDEITKDALVLVEWAENAQNRQRDTRLSEDRLDLRLALKPGQPNARHATLVGHGRFADRLDRLKSIVQFLSDTPFKDAKRVFMQGDASSRVYERLILPDRHAILMISPRRPDGPPIRLGRPYSTIARLATSVEPFVAMTLGLRGLGYSAPDLLAANLAAGLLLVEDLGQNGVIDAQGPIEARYGLAVDFLADLHQRALPRILPVPGGSDYSIPLYDLDAFLIEAELLLDWYFPHALGRTPDAMTRRSFVDAWRNALEPILAEAPSWVLRDFHSPNLIYLPQRAGLAALGLIDYQDCVLGPPAYDLVSLLQDARTSVPEAMEVALLTRYVRLRRQHDPAFDLLSFTRFYALMGAQRATKILGIFVRLDRRDGKPAYLKHLPRIETYLRRALAHPGLAPLMDWYSTFLPGVVAPTNQQDNGIHADRAGHGSGGGVRDQDAPLDPAAPQTLDQGARNPATGS
jgi:N-acetylmuramate 1-kinase